jgi:hypothetical protein
VRKLEFEVYLEGLGVDGYLVLKRKLIKMGRKWTGIRLRIGKVLTF